jgi:rhamnose utilization protein RhaD (predicted bifunctional aldolase and dehydrogenase)
MWIKASGKRLADARRADLFVPVDVELFHAALAAGVELPAQKAVIGGSNLRPSIETAFHAVLPHTYVLHVHSVSILAHAVVDTGKEALAARLADLPWSWIRYVRPGWELAQEIAAATVDNARARVFVLANHGLVVAGDDLEATTALLHQAVALAETPKRPLQLPDESIFAHRLNRVARSGSALRPARASLTHTLALDPISYRICQSGVLYPDQAVYLGDKIHGCTSHHGDCVSPYEVVEGVGVFVAENAPPSIDAMLQCHADVLARISGDATVCTLSDAEVGELISWDAEEYRRSASP